MSVEQVAAEFAKTSVGATPWDAHDQCYAESKRFQGALAAAGIVSVLVDGVRWGEFQGQRVLLAGHWAVQVGEGADTVVYDWTARQFWEGLVSEYETVPFPLVQPVSEWRKDWPSLHL